MNLKKPKKVDFENVCKWVTDGLHRINQELATHYQLKRIQFVVSDSPSAEVYAPLELCIVVRMHTSQNAFNGTTA